MKFAVITAIPDPEKHLDHQKNENLYPDGNMCNTIDIYFDDPDRDTLDPKPLKPAFMHVNVVVPVFELGEVLIINEEYEREIVGSGRSPSKWCVDYETFDTVEEAVEKAQDVLRDEGWKY